MWPGNTADVTTLIPVIDRLRRRFAIARVCVVADMTGDGFVRPWNGRPTRFWLQRVRCSRCVYAAISSWAVSPDRGFRRPDDPAWASQV
jgi:hypothetical protein